jgi:hypothetical protein
MTTKLREEQTKAFGECVPCQLGPLPPPGKPAAGSIGSGKPGPSVLVVDPDKADIWIGIELLDTDKKPVPGAAFDVLVSGGKHVTGRLDPNGKVRIEGIDPAPCTITFPELDRRDFV